MSTALTIGLAVTGWFTQPVIQNLVDRVAKLLDLVLQSSDLAHDLRQLSSDFEEARAVLCRAKRKGLANKHDGLARLAEQLIGALYDAEDLLGDLDYEALRRKIEEGEAVDSPTFSPSYLADGNGDIESIMREVGDRLGQTVKKLEDFLNSEDGRMLRVERGRETSSFLTMPKVFGREVEKETIVKLLLSGSDDASVTPRDHAEASFSVLPIIGAVGVGKTTLAQYVYDNQRESEHFNLKMWVCVSHSLDVKRLTKQMIESATGEMQADLLLDSLQVILKKKVKSQRFLLVLDDVREDDTDSEEWRMREKQWMREEQWMREKWQDLCAPLRQGLQGSMILVTACSQMVARVMGTMQPMHLKGLSDDDCWKIFKSRPFGPEAVPNNLEAVDTSMAANLKGSPSAAIYLACQLRGATGVGDWRRIMNKEMWECGITEPLLSSYQNLPHHLKQCFSFCSVFPKQYPFNQRELVGVWMAQGYIAPEKDTQMEDVGTRYLHHLIDKFFFEHTQQDHRQYIIPDLMHGLAHLVSKKECFMLQDKCHHRMPSTIRHLSVSVENMELNKLKIGRNSKLRSLLIFKNIMPNLELANQWFDPLKYIRLLNLRYCIINRLPDSIGNLKHLRYLDISWTGITKLPEMLCLLYNLQVLNMRGCSLESFPEGFTKLINLRYLDVGVNLISKITKIGRLTSLQELQQFQVLKKDGHGIGELKDLSQLRGRLHIKDLENIESEEDACQAKLDKKEYMDELFLEWSPSRSSFAFDTEVLEGLRPHQHLEQLKIRHYGGEKSPSWLHQNLLSSISKLHIENCPNLKILRLGSLEALTSLKNLTILKCYELQICEPVMSNDAVNGELMMLQELEIDETTRSKLSFLDNLELSSLALVISESAKSVLFVGEEERYWLKILRSVEKLWFKTCINLQSLPTWLSSLTSLKKLWITDCPNINSPLDNALRTSLGDGLYVNNCGPILMG